MYKSQ